MWLLNTSTATLEYFNRPEDVPGGYAILSHVWGDPSDEDTFQTVKAAAKRCEKGKVRLNASAQLPDTVEQLQEMVTALVAEQLRALMLTRHTALPDSTGGSDASSSQELLLRPSSSDSAAPRGSIVDQMDSGRRKVL